VSIVANFALIVHWVKNDREAGLKRMVARPVVRVVGIAILAIPVWGDLQPGLAAP
jgi:hypothetical protein